MNVGSNLKYISQFMKNNTKTNSIVATVPHCYDLATNSNVNQEVLKFNSKLCNQTK